MAGLCVQAHGRTGGTAQEWVRNMLGCVGRGGNAQAIRDEILHIMHRHHIGEKRGTWMEVLVCSAHNASCLPKIDPAAFLFGSPSFMPFQDPAALSFQNDAVSLPRVCFLTA